MRQYSLRAVLGLSLLLLVALPAVLLAWLLVERPLQNVQDLASKSLMGAAVQSQKSIEAHLMQAHHALDGLLPADISEFQATQALLWVSDPALFAPMAIALSRASKDLRFVYYRSEGGGVHGVENTVDGFRFNDRGAVDGGARAALLIPPNAPLRSSSGGESPDPRSMPWQDASVAADKRSFSAATVYPISRQLVVTLSQPVIGPTGLIAGVLGVDLSLQALPDLLRAQPVSPGGVAYLLDDKGLLLASTADAAGGVYQGSQWLLRIPGDSSNPLVRASFAALQAKWLAVPASKTAAAQQAARLASKEGPLLAFHTRVGQHLGLQWTLVMAVPESDFSRPADGATRLALSGLALLLLACLALAVWGGRHLERNFARLGRSIDQLRRGVIPSSARFTPLLEFNWLASGLHSVAVKINESRTDAFAEALVLSDSSGEHAPGLQALQTRLAARTSELAAARDQANAATRGQTAFLAVIRHELRTPLNGVVGMSALLADTPLDTEQCDYLKSLVTACNQLQTVVEDILEYSRVESGEILLQNIAFDVRAVVQEACSTPAKAAHAKGLKLIVDAPGEVKHGNKPAVPWRVQGDPDRLCQVIGELLVNAVKFTDSGSVTVRVRPLYNPDPLEVPMLEVQVTDTGTGISANDTGKVFTAFTQLDASISRRHGGTGLGLATCKRLVELMGGQLSVQSHEAKGSIFRFAVLSPWAPAGQQQSAWLAQEQPVLPAMPERDALEKTRILVVDDNLINLKVACAMLLKLNYQVLTAEGGEQAITAVADALGRGKPLAMVVMDVHMPDVDGIAATRAIIAAHGPLAPPIIALTAASSADDCQRCLDAGMVEYLSKPLQIGALAKSLEKWVTPANRPAKKSALKTLAVLALPLPEPTAPALAAKPEHVTRVQEQSSLRQAERSRGEVGSAPAPLFERFSDANISIPTELVDFCRLSDFKEFDDPQLSMTREVIGLLFSEVPVQLTMIERAISKNDVSALAASAHLLRGAASNVGAVTVQHLCSVLERSTLELQAIPPDAPGCLIALRIAWNRTRPLLENWH